MEWKKGVLYIGGDAPKKELIPDSIIYDSFMIAADSGLECALRYGVEPHLILGDMDSLSNIDLLEGREERTKRFPEDKDETDTEIGINVFREMGISDITIIGGGGGRVDHEYALFILFNRDFHPTRWFSGRSAVRSIAHSLAVSAQPGTMISFFPAGSGPWEMTSSGLAWPLDSLRWKMGDFGISNRFREAKVTVTMRRGRLLAVHDLSGVTELGE